MDPEMNNQQVKIKPPSLLDALIPIIFLIVLLASAIVLYGADGTTGPIQIALMLSMLVAGLVGLKNGHKWADIGKAAVDGISQAMGAIFILLGVDALINTWSMAGTVATIVHYGIQFLDPNWYYLATAVICGVLALSINSAWTVANTLGVGLIGIANLLDVSPEITAGAVISKAYFGDKISPLSETTNLAPAVSGTELFTHIKNMLWTTVTIECDACHNETAEMKDFARMPSSIRITGLGQESNCIECHQGRASAVDVWEAINKLPEDEVNTELSLPNIHDNPAGVTIYSTEAKGGDEYPAYDYVGKFYHGFDTCITCHNSHTLDVRVDNCSACHLGATMIEGVRNIRLSKVDYDDDGDIAEGLAGEIETMMEKLLITMRLYAALMDDVNRIEYDSGFITDSGGEYTI